MPTAVSQGAQARQHAPDDLDKLLEYDGAVEDFLKDFPLNTNDSNGANTTEPQKGIDEEITLKRKRKPNPKLDETLLLSRHGIPRLRRISKDRLQLRGKGHEFNDIGRLLNMYQLWMDDMYPRAKFRDAMAMVEKVGHSKRMQVMRRTWLDDTKPGRAERVDDAIASAEKHGEVDVASSGDAYGEAPVGDRSHARHDNVEEQLVDDVPAEDDLDMLLAESNNTTTGMATSNPKRPMGPFEEDEPEADEPNNTGVLAMRSDGARPAAVPTANLDGEPDEDDLDALLAEHEADTSANISHAPTRKHMGGIAQDNEFADEEEAMAEMGGMW